MMKIATLDDIERMYTLALRGHQEGEYLFPVVESHAKNSLANLISNPDCLVLIAEDQGEIVGVIVGMVSTHMFYSVKVATEFHWYVIPEYRNTKIALELFEAFEYWAIRYKHVDILAVNSRINEPRLEKFYKRHNYRLKETYWTKEFH